METSLLFYCIYCEMVIQTVGNGYSSQYTRCHGDSEIITNCQKSLCGHACMQLSTIQWTNITWVICVSFEQRYNFMWSVFPLILYIFSMIPIHFTFPRLKYIDELGWYNETCLIILAFTKSCFIPRHEGSPVVKTTKYSGLYASVSLSHLSIAHRHI